MSWNKKNVQRWFRVLHRDIGYLAVGITLVYALSGFFLLHKNIFSGTKTEDFSINFPKDLKSDDFINYWNTNTSVNVNHLEESDNQIIIFLEGGTGDYDKAGGKVYYEIYKKRTIITFLNQLHNNQKKGWIYIADIYVFILIFLAVSGLVMVNGKNGFLKRGVWIMISGFILVMVFIFF